MQGSREEHLCFEIRPSFEPAVTLRLLSTPAAQGDQTYVLACSVMGFTTDRGTWEVAVTAGPQGLERLNPVYCAASFFLRALVSNGI
jgi:hypothetical protein